jgi:Rieske Fe-S protein
MSEHAPHPTRRTLLRGAAVGGVTLPLLAACGGGGASSADTPSGGATKVAAADVPVGGGTILAGPKLVVTQPAQGEFKAFTAVCTHQGCTVTRVEGGDIICPCHGSHFSIKDGAALSGPAQSGLAEKKVSVAGGQISVS